MKTEKIQRIKNPKILYRICFDLRNDFRDMVEKYGSYWFIEPDRWGWATKSRKDLVSNQHCQGSGIFMQVTDADNITEFTPTKAERSGK